MTASSYRSTATVETDRCDRWIKQLRSHLGRKAEVSQDDDGATVLLLAGGRCRMHGDDSTLRFDASAPDEYALARIETVIGGHLERFAADEGLVVRWQR